MKRNEGFFGCNLEKVKKTCVQKRKLIPNGSDFTKRVDVNSRKRSNLESLSYSCADVLRSLRRV
jgi:hypothetical protein